MPDTLILLPQIVVIVALARLLGKLFRRIHEPQVVGEMVAGVALGPSLLGWFSPGLEAALFPAESLGYLHGLSHIGLLLFSFLVGLELDFETFRGLGKTAAIATYSSIVVPFALGMALAVVLYPRLAPPEVALSTFAIFLGAAMSITAFPVLARILDETRLLQTRLGRVAIACAAVGDVIGWFLLAAVVLMSRASGGTELLVTLVGTAVFLAFVRFVARPCLVKLAADWDDRMGLGHDRLAAILLMLLVSAWLTELIGLHALFGAFCLGVVMPSHRGMIEALRQKVGDLTTVLLLPVFFAFTGLRTSIGLLATREDWLLCGLIILLAVAGKLGGAALGARATGMSGRESFAFGALMNTRGLMELVLLGIGLDLGIVSERMFAMLVLMAIVTTFMTTPILEFVYLRPLSRIPAQIAPVERAGAQP